MLPAYEVDLTGDCSNCVRATVGSANFTADLIAGTLRGSGDTRETPCCAGRRRVYGARAGVAAAPLATTEGHRCACTSPQADPAPQHSPFEGVVPVPAPDEVSSGLSCLQAIQCVPDAIVVPVAGPRPVGSARGPGEDGAPERHLAARGGSGRRVGIIPGSEVAGEDGGPVLRSGHPSLGRVATETGQDHLVGDPGQEPDVACLLTHESLVPLVPACVDVPGPNPHYPPSSR